LFSSLPTTSLLSFYGFILYQYTFKKVDVKK